MRVALATVIGLLGLAFTAGAAAQESIRIGVSAPLSADLASYGKSVRDATVLAADELNAAGGIGGRKIELIVEDNQSKPEQAKTVFEKLIKRDKVVAIVGDVTSTATLAAAPVAQQNGIPMLTPTATNERVTTVGNYVFRSCFMDLLQGSAMAKFAIEDLKAKRIAVLYNAKDSYSTGLRDVFIKYAKANGIEIVADLSYASKDADFAGQLTRIRSANPDAIYAPGYYQEIGPICVQARELRIKVPLLGSDGWDSDKTAEIGGDAINGCYFTNHYSAEDPRPEVQAFVSAYKGRYGRVPDALAILGYDAMKIMADAIGRAGSTEGAKVREALASTKDFQAASGKITIDAQRNAVKPVVILKIEDKAFRYHKTIDMQ